MEKYYQFPTGWDDYTMLTAEDIREHVTVNWKYYGLSQRRAKREEQVDELVCELGAHYEAYYLASDVDGE